MKKFFLLAGIIVSAAYTQAQTINIPRGLSFESSGTANMNMEMMGQKMTMISSSSTSTSTKEASDTGFVFTNTIKRIALQMEGIGQHIQFDSDKKEDLETPIGNSVKDIIGSSQEIAVSKQGKITHFSSDKQSSPQLMEAMNFAGQISVGIPYYMLIPSIKNNTKIGDSWVDSSGTSPETMQTVSNYTLKSITDSGITISFVTTLALNRPVEQQGITMNMNLKGNMTGEAVYDKATGLLKSNNALCDMTGKMDVMGQAVPLTIKGNTTLTVKQ